MRAVSGAGHEVVASRVYIPIEYRDPEELVAGDGGPVHVLVSGTCVHHPRRPPGLVGGAPHGLGGLRRGALHGLVDGDGGLRDGYPAGPHGAEGVRLPHGPVELPRIPVGLVVHPLHLAEGVVGDLHDAVADVLPHPRPHGLGELPPALRLDLLGEHALGADPFRGVGEQLVVIGGQDGGLLVPEAVHGDEDVLPRRHGVGGELAPETAEHTEVPAGQPPLVPLPRPVYLRLRPLNLGVGRLAVR